MPKYGPRKRNPFSEVGDIADSELFDALAQILTESNLTKNDIAERLGLTPRIIEINLRDSPIYWHRVAEIAAAAGYVFQFRFIPVEREKPPWPDWWEEPQ